MMGRTSNSRRRLLGSGAAMLLLAPFAAGTTKAAELDGELIALCRQYEANEKEWVRLNRIADIRPGETDQALRAAAAEAAAARDELPYGELLDQIAELPARTPEGLQAKARAVFAFFSPEPPEYESAGGRALWSLVCELAGEDKTDRRWRPAPLLQASHAPESRTPWQNPDAELIALCAEHIENVRVYGEYGGRLP